MRLGDMFAREGESAFTEDVHAWRRVARYSHVAPLLGMRPDISALQLWTAYEEVVLGRSRRPADFGEAQDEQIRLNPLGLIYE